MLGNVALRWSNFSSGIARSCAAFCSLFWGDEKLRKFGVTSPPSELCLDNGRCTESLAFGGDDTLGMKLLVSSENSTAQGDLAVSSRLDAVASIFWLSM